MILIYKLKLLTNLFYKPRFIVGFFLFFSFSLFNYVYADTELEERLYSKMKDSELFKATENLLLALENNQDGEKLEWSNGSYKGYIIPISTTINDEGYFCRDYFEVLIRFSEYSMYENKACRDHNGEWIWIQTQSPE